MIHEAPTKQNKTNDDYRFDILLSQMCVTDGSILKEMQNASLKHKKKNKNR